MRMDYDRKHSPDGCTMASYVAMLTHGYRYKGNRVVDGTVCVVLEGGVLQVIGITAEKLGWRGRR